MSCFEAHPVAEGPLALCVTLAEGSAPSKVVRVQAVSHMRDPQKPAHREMYSGPMDWDEAPRHVPEGAVRSA